MKAVGIRIAWIVRKVFARAGGVLDGRYHLRVLRTPREVRNALAYVLLNARKHLADALVRKVGRAAIGGAMPPGGVDPASSGRWFSGWARRVQEASGPVPVTRPRTWLASVGWRKHGRIDWSEIPSGIGRSYP